MENNRWLSSIRKKREIKRTERLRKKYDFLIKEVYASQNKIIEQVAMKETSLCEQISLLQKEQQTCMQQMKEQFVAVNKELESIELSNNSTQAKSIELLGDYSKKTIMEISETESRTKEKIAGIQEELEARNKEIQQLMESISDKIEMVQKNVTEKCSTLVEDKTTTFCEQISLLQKEQQTCIQQMKEQFVAVNKELESIELSNNSTQAKSIELLGDYSKKTIMEISETESRTKEKIAGIQEGLEARNKEIQQLMESISDKIEMVQKNATEKCSTLVEDRTNSIILNIDEVKELMKIVAVNNLLDEM